MLAYHRIADEKSNLGIHAFLLSTAFKIDKLELKVNVRNNDNI